VALNVDQDARAIGDHHLEGCAQLVSALAVRGTEDLSGQALGMHARQRSARGNVSVYERYLLISGGAVQIPEGEKFPVHRGKPDLDHPLNSCLRHAVCREFMVCHALTLPPVQPSLGLLSEKVNRTADTRN
jgi:hypothetical protein